MVILFIWVGDSVVSHSMRLNMREPMCGCVCSDRTTICVVCYVLACDHRRTTNFSAFSQELKGARDQSSGNRRIEISVH